MGGATRPDDYPHAIFLEPVSQECLDCNHATLAEIIGAGLAGDLAAYEAAWARHYPGRKLRPARLPKRNGGPAPPGPPFPIETQTAGKRPEVMPIVLGDADSDRADVR